MSPGCVPVRNTASQGHYIASLHEVPEVIYSDGLGWGISTCYARKGRWVRRYDVTSGMTSLPARQLYGNSRQLSDNFPTGDWGEVGKSRGGMGRGESTSLVVSGGVRMRMRDGS